MLRFFFLLLLSNFFSAQLADSQSPNDTLPIPASIPCEEVRLSLEAMTLKLNQQTQVLEKITAKLGINSDLDSDDANKNGSLSRRYPRSCAEATTVNSQSGIYIIKEPSFSIEAFPVYCNTEEQGGGWTVIQRRVDDSVNFYRDWNSYKDGFGDLTGNFFIGLDKLHALTNPKPQELLITLTDFKNITRYAKYDSFAIGDESQSYVLYVLGKYIAGKAGDSLRNNLGFEFSTKDKPNDPFKLNCAVKDNGAWWYNTCESSNLNGLYLKGVYRDKNVQGITWPKWHGYYYSLKTVNMMIRPKRN